ncbi:MAG: OsmC family protein [Streptosporangiaceae bacterium]
MTETQVLPVGQLRTDQLRVRTSCGRTLDVGVMKLGDEHRPASRVTMRVGQCPQCGDGSWAALTPGEARRLGHALLAQAADAEVPGPQPDGSGRVDVTWSGGESYRIAARGHDLLTDQPVANGGQDLAPTPTELMVGSIASCIAFYVGRYLRRHDLDPVGFGVRADFGMASDRPARISDVHIAICVPSGVPVDRRQALLAVASHCTVHNTLRQPPEVTITLD